MFNFFLNPAVLLIPVSKEPMEQVNKKIRLILGKATNAYCVADTFWEVANLMHNLIFKW